MPSFQFNLTATNTPQQLTGSVAHFRSASMFAISGFTTSGTSINNAVNINLGINSGQMPITTAPGGTFTLAQNTIQEYDNLQQYWAMGKLGDGLYVIYN